ncbi:hypothetical protein BAY1663_00978 [Pseudomonas sp. BAY1663]|nr:hypothetical protein BAY1663_00978 [Pseudomonas sp. BAY1663]
MPANQALQAIAGMARSYDTRQACLEMNGHRT